MTDVVMAFGVLGFVLCLVGLTDIAMRADRANGELAPLLAAMAVSVFVAVNPDLLPSLAARLVGGPEPAPAGPPSAWLFWLAGAVFIVGNAAVIISARIRRTWPHRPFCTCATCYRAAVERGEVAAMMDRYRTAREHADGEDGAAVVRAANAIREEYLQVGGQWYRKVPRPDGWIGVVRVTEPDR